MRYFFAILLIFPCLLRAQTIERKSQETTNAFIKRVKPVKMHLAHPVIETDKWIENKKVIIAFFTHGELGGYAIDTNETGSGYDKYIVGYLFIPLGENLYTRMLIDTFTYSNDDYEHTVNIDAVFFANADSLQDKEMCIILTKYREGMEHCMVFFNRFYRQPDMSLPPSRLTFLRKISSHFSQEQSDCVNAFGHIISTAKYTTAGEIKLELLRMGYK